METSTTLILPFLAGVLRDIRDLYPDANFSYEEEYLTDVIAFYQDDVIAVELSRIGKAFEISLITGESLNFGNLCFLPMQDGSGYPRFLGFLWETVFTCSGVPYHKEDDSSMWVVSPAVKQTRALAVLCLRQFFLGFSKLSSMECLRRGKRRDRPVSEENRISTWSEMRERYPRMRQTSDSMFNHRRRSSECDLGSVL